MQKNFNNRNQSRDGNFKKRPFKGKRHRREDFYLPGCGLGVKAERADKGHVWTAIMDGKAS